MNTPIKKVAPRTDANRDPISGAPGAHPIGTGLGAAAGGVAAGALAGTVAGPVGTVLGAAIGAMAGGLAGKGIAEAIDPTAEETYWRDNFSSRPYVKGNGKFDDYGPAYRHGVDSYARSKGRSFEDAEPELKRDWERVRGNSSLSWENAKDASRDAWQRLSDAVERAVPGDSDRDGK
jgi:phage tail tape-measure protein